MSEHAKLILGFTIMALAVIGALVILRALWRGFCATARAVGRVARRTHTAARASWGHVARYYHAQSEARARKLETKEKRQHAAQVATAHRAVELAADALMHFTRLQCKLDEIELGTRMPERKASDTILPS